MSKIIANGQKICRIRIHRGLSAKELAKIAGLSEFGLKRIENNCTKNPRPITAKLIADALGVDFDELFTIVNDNEKFEICIE